MLIKGIRKIFKLFYDNEARVFLRFTRREKWIAYKRFRRSLVYSILIFYIFFMYLGDMHQGGTIFQAYLDYQQEKMINKELEEYYIHMGWVWYDD